VGADFHRQPEALQEIRHIIFHLAFRVGQFPKHGGRSFPRNLTLNVQVPHRVAMALILAEDFGDQLRSRAVGGLAFLSS
jgi:hypothetical protein